LLQEIEDEKILTLPSVDIIISAIWDRAFKTIIYFVFLPYVLYFGIFVVYISFIYDIESNRFWAYILLPYCFVYSILQLVFEAK
jgi:hypothetical protein